MGEGLTDPTLVTLGLSLVILGIALTFLGFILMAFHSARRVGKARFGGAVLVGPFPIIFGDRAMVKYAFILLIICIALTLIFILI